MTLAIFTQPNGRLCFSTLMRISLSRWGCEYLKCHVYRESRHKLKRRSQQRMEERAEKHRSESVLDGGNKYQLP